MKYMKDFLFYESRSDSLPSDMQNHHHATYEIYHLETGSCTYFIDNRLYHLEAGDTVFIAKDILHKTTYYESHSRLLLNFNESYLKNIKFPAINIFRNRNQKGAIRSILHRIEDEYRRNDNFSRTIMKGLIAELIAITGRYENLYEDSLGGNEYVNRCLSYIDSNLINQISLENAAKAASITREYLSRIFKTETGLGFAEYVNIRRLETAEKLLMANQMLSISEIAERSGFNDSNYFSLKFKDHYGESPLQYRKKLRKFLG